MCNKKSCTTHTTFVAVQLTNCPGWFIWFRITFVIKRWKDLSWEILGQDTPSFNSGVPIFRRFPHLLVDQTGISTYEFSSEKITFTLFLQKYLQSLFFFSVEQIVHFSVYKSSCQTLDNPNKMPTCNLFPNKFQKINFRMVDHLQYLHCLFNYFISFSFFFYQT